MLERTDEFSPFSIIWLAEISHVEGLMLFVPLPSKNR